MSVRHRSMVKLMTQVLWIPALISSVLLMGIMHSCDCWMVSESPVGIEWICLMKREISCSIYQLCLWVVYFILFSAIWSVNGNEIITWYSFFSITGMESHMEICMLFWHLYLTAPENMNNLETSLFFKFFGICYVEKVGGSNRKRQLIRKSLPVTPPPPNHFARSFAEWYRG